MKKTLSAILLSLLVSPLVAEASPTICHSRSTAITYEAAPGGEDADINFGRVRSFDRAGRANIAWNETATVFVDSVKDLAPNRDGSAGVELNLAINGEGNAIVLRVRFDRAGGWNKAEIRSASSVRESAICFPSR